MSYLPDCPISAALSQKIHSLAVWLAQLARCQVPLLRLGKSVVPRTWPETCPASSGGISLLAVTFTGGIIPAVTSVAPSLLKRSKSQSQPSTWSGALGDRPEGYDDSGAGKEEAQYSMCRLEGATTKQCSHDLGKSMLSHVMTNGALQYFKQGKRFW